MPFVLHNYEKYNESDTRCCISFWLFLIICGFICIIFYIYFEIVCAIMYWLMLTVLFFTTLDKCLSINKINYW